MCNASWSDDRVATLRKLWFDGLSASQIARRLGGVTRNAVIGKVHRLGLCGRGATQPPSRVRRASTPRLPRARPAPRPQTTRPAPLAVALPSEGPGLAADLVQLGARACKWPIGDPKSPDFSFCGRHTEGRYCAAHAQLSVHPGTTCRLDRDPVVRRALAGLV